VTDFALGETVRRLPRNPVHLFQNNQSATEYHNAMGCGAFSTAMALSVYNPDYGTYEMAQSFFAQMLKVPFFGGTFENQDAAVARRLGFHADSYGMGTLTDLMTAIDLGAPAVILINPTHLGIGTHDVLLVGYSVDAEGTPLRLFIDNPAVESGAQKARPGQIYPGNQTIEAPDVDQKWTHVFSPIFADPAVYDRWRAQTRRG
jgi:hypothetical protein